MQWGNSWYDEQFIIPIFLWHDFMCYGKLFKLTSKQRKTLRNGVTPDGVKKVSKFIFNKNNEIFVTVLGNAEEKDVPNLDYFRKKFLIAE